MAELNINQKTEENTETDNERATETQPTPASFTDLLAGKLPEIQKPKEGETEDSKEEVVEDGNQDDPEQPEPKETDEPEEKVEEKETPEKKEDDDADLLRRQNAGLINEIQRLRQKLREKKNSNDEYDYSSEETTDAEQKVDTSNYASQRDLAICDEQARNKYSDYDEAYKAFESVLLDRKSGTVLDNSLYHELMTSVHPGEFAYQRGKRLLTMKKYGTDNPDVLIKKITDELTPQIEKRVKNDLTKELTGKLAKRNKTPTDISGARAASGDSEPDYRPITFGGALQRLRKGS